MVCVCLCVQTADNESWHCQTGILHGSPHGSKQQHWPRRYSSDIIVYHEVHLSAFSLALNISINCPCCTIMFLYWIWSTYIHFNVFFKALWLKLCVHVNICNRWDLYHWTRQQVSRRVNWSPSCRHSCQHDVSSDGESWAVAHQCWAHNRGHKARCRAKFQHSIFTSRGGPVSEQARLQVK